MNTPQPAPVTEEHRALVSVCFQAFHAARQAGKSNEDAVGDLIDAVANAFAAKDAEIARLKSERDVTGLAQPAAQADAWQQKTPNERLADLVGSAEAARIRASQAEKGGAE